MKACFKCGAEKPLSDFYRHSQMADGHLNKCKSCTRHDVWLHRQANVERIREFDRIRGQGADRTAQRVRIAKDYLRKHPDRAAAMQAVARAVRSGTLRRQPCFICGEEKTEAHHPDYSNKLGVVWLCVLHHRELHLAYPEDHYHQTP